MVYLRDAKASRKSVFTLLIKFLAFRIKNNDKKAKLSRNVIEAQNEKLKTLGNEEKKLQGEKQDKCEAGIPPGRHHNETRNPENCVKRGSQEIDLRQDFYNLTQLSQSLKVDFADFPAYVQVMAKTLGDQAQDLRKIR